MIDKSYRRPDWADNEMIDAYRSTMGPRDEEYYSTVHRSPVRGQMDTGTGRRIRPVMYWERNDLA